MLTFSKKTTDKYQEEELRPTYPFRAVQCPFRSLSSSKSIITMSFDVSQIKNTRVMGVELRNSKKHYPV